MYNNCNLIFVFVLSLSLTASHDKGAAMTLILQEASPGHIARCRQEEYLLAVNSNNRILFHKKLATYKEKKIAFPLVAEFLKKTKHIFLINYIAGNVSGKFICHITS